MPSTGTAEVTLPSPTQILITRKFDAPAHLIYEAYTTPELVKRWWSGKRGEVTSAEIDLRVGGEWRYVMTASGGHEVAFHGTFSELVPGERIVHTEVFEGAPVPDPDALATDNTITFSEQDGGTLYTCLVDAPNREVRDAIIESGMEAGMQEGMDLLEEVAHSLA